MPVINEASCTDCGICRERCPQNSRPSFTNNECISVLGARYKDDELLKKSASGGVFIGIAAMILETPGNAVFGCAFDEDMVAHHVCVTGMKDIAPLQSSKYVQSDTGDTYLQAKAMLEESKTVFYTGCPCQIAGLYAFLGKDYDNLLTADLICHGVPSPLLFKRYMDRLGKQLGETVIYYDFRSKEKGGWGLKNVTECKSRAKSKIAPLAASTYSYSFGERRVQRECCYSCKYTNANRVGDITIGDFWGIEAAHPKFFDSRGVSVVLINTSKGERFFNMVRSGFDVIESTYEKASAQQTNLREPSPRPAVRDNAYKGIDNEAVDIFKNAAFKISVKVRVKASIKQITPLFAIRFYKKMKRKLMGR